MQKLTLILSGIMGIILTMYYHRILPEQVASSFGENGRAQAFMSNETSLYFGVGLYILITGLFLAVPYLIRVVPVKYINFPNKDYWLVEDRKESTIETMSGWMYVFGFATNVLMIVMGLLTFKANMSGKMRLDMGTFVTVLVLYLAFTAGWVICFYRSFRLPKDTNVI
jgi:uncharacterized membrane protein